jgi:hypothetical protein
LRDDKGAAMRTTNALIWLRFVAGLLIAPLLWLPLYYAAVRDEPLLGGAQIVFYAAGLIWLSIILAFAKLITLAMRQTLSAFVLIAACVASSIIITVFTLDDSQASSGLGMLGLEIPDMLIFPTIDLSTALVFALIAGLRWRAK